MRECDGWWLVHACMSLSSSTVTVTSLCSHVMPLRLLVVYLPDQDVVTLQIAVGVCGGREREREREI